MWHPALLTVDDVEILDGHKHSTPLGEIYRYEPGWGQLDEVNAAAIIDIMAGSTPHGDTGRRQAVPST